MAAIPSSKHVNPVTHIYMSRYPEMVAWYAGLRDHIVDSPRFVKVHGIFRALPGQANARVQDFGQIKDLHSKLVARIKCYLDDDPTPLMMQAIDEFVRETLKTPTVATDGSSLVERSAKTLADLGHVALPPIDPAALSRMRAYLAEQPVHPNFAALGPERCGLDEARRGKFASYPIGTVVNCPHLLEIANDPATLSIIERHLGTVPNILGCSVWWSFATDVSPVEAQLYHYDVDDYRFCKMFIYLTDVTEETGPHAFMERTHDHAYVAAMRLEWGGGTAEFDQWFLGVFRKSDEDVKRFFGADPALLTGPAGTSFLADTCGLHKGMPPQIGERLVCQVLYGVTPLVQEPFDRLEMGTNTPDHLPARLVEPANRYVNRFFVGPAMAQAPVPA